MTGLAGKRRFGTGFLTNLICDSVALQYFGEGTRCGHETLDWRFLEERFGEVYTDDACRPLLPTRLMAGLAIPKHTYDLSVEVLCEHWGENPYYQYFRGEKLFLPSWCSIVRR